jgi:hypothetical protein
MDTFGIIAFSMAASALGFSIMNTQRNNKLEEKLRDFDVIPKEFESLKEIDRSPRAKG